MPVFTWNGSYRGCWVDWWAHVSWVVCFHSPNSIGSCRSSHIIIGFLICQSTVFTFLGDAEEESFYLPMTNLQNRKVDISPDRQEQNATSSLIVFIIKAISHWLWLLRWGSGRDLTSTLGHILTHTARTHTLQLVLCASLSLSFSFSHSHSHSPHPTPYTHTHTHKHVGTK